MHLVINNWTVWRRKRVLFVKGHHELTNMTPRCLIFDKEVDDLKMSRDVTLLEVWGADGEFFEFGTFNCTSSHAPSCRTSSDFINKNNTNNNNIDKKDTTLYFRIESTVYNLNLVGNIGIIYSILCFIGTVCSISCVDCYYLRYTVFPLILFLQYIEVCV